MITTPMEAPSLYAQVMSLQDQLICNGTLLQREHDVLEGHFCDDGTTHILCCCGRGMWRPDDQSERAYAEHVMSALRSSQALAA